MLFLLDDRTVAVAPRVGKAEETLLSRRDEDLAFRLVFGVMWGLSCLIGSLAAVYESGGNAAQALLAPSVGSIVAAAIFAFTVAIPSDPRGPLFTTAWRGGPPRLRWRYGILALLGVVLPIAVFGVMVYNMTLVANPLVRLAIAAIAAAQIIVGIRVGYAMPYLVWRIYWLTKQVHLDGRAILCTYDWSDVLPAYPTTSSEEFVRQYNQTCRANPTVANAMDAALISYITEAREALGYMAEASEDIRGQAKGELTRLRDSVVGQTSSHIWRHLSTINAQKLEEESTIQERENLLAQQRVEESDKMLSDWLSKKGANYQRS